MNSDQFFKEISDGLIDHSIEFSIGSYAVKGLVSAIMRLAVLL